MPRRSILLLAVLPLLAACGRKAEPDAPMNDEPKRQSRVELGIGGDRDEPRRLAFEIVAVHEKQTPMDDPPHRRSGGEWTFLDCRAAGSPGVAFTVGLASKGGGGGTPVAWGNAVLIVGDRQAGGRFVEAFGKAFSAKVPAPSGRAYTPPPLAIRTAILGENKDREGAGGFSGEGGGWAATKWFPEHDGFSGEIYFNYSLRERRGEFSEKDSDYGDDLAATFASALRDGPRPERTPENDPTLTDVRPRIGEPRRLPQRLAGYYGFSPRARFAVYQDGGTISALPLDRPDAIPFEVARFDHPSWEVHVLDDELDLLVQEGVPETPGVRSSADPMRLWWVDGGSREKSLLQGPKREIGFAESPASPDGRFVAFTEWTGDPRKAGRTQMIHILDRVGGGAAVCESKAKDMSAVGWEETRLGPRLVVVTNRWQFEGKPASEAYLADPATGIMARREGVDARLEIDNPASPDGGRRVRVGEDHLIVTDADGAQRRFDFHADDRRFVGPGCIDWAGPNYLRFHGPRLALIDVKAMKMCYPRVAVEPGKPDPHTFKFSPDFRWALHRGDVTGGEGLYLSRVEMPGRP